MELLKNTHPLYRDLESGCNALGLQLSDKHIERLLDYLDLLQKWNRAYNLSAIREPVEILSKHLLDSLSIVHQLKPEKFSRVIDVGTGAGLPGVPLAVCFPDCEFTLLDSAGKKTRFLHQVQQSLALTNVNIVNCRVEEYSATKFDIVVSRAFASLAQMTNLCGHLLGESGEFWAMKGIFPQLELREIEKHYMVSDRIELNVPGVEGARCLLRIRKK